MDLRRMLPRALVVALFGILAPLLLTPISPAAAGTTVLCRGFVNCNAKGRSNAGYEKVYNQMWWRMYAGHNCTNYAAYRMVRAGLSSTRPWSGSGNASNWGVQLASRTDRTPMVGAVAWWHDRNHVQFVEQVVDANTIIVSEDHYRGDFDWARVTRDSGSWPDGFIHLADAQLAATRAPNIAGTPEVDAPLTVDPGGWTPAPSRYSYQWVLDGTAISGATARTFTPTAAQARRSLTVRVTASRNGYVGGSRTTPASVVQPGDMKVLKLPAVSGTPKVGATLTVTRGYWSPEATGRRVQWMADGEPIEGATTGTLKLGSAQLNKVITAVYTATRRGYNTQVVPSLPTEPVGPLNIALTEDPVLTGSPMYGRTLTVSRGAFSPADVTVGFTWLRDGIPITGATDATYTTTADDVGKRVSVRVSYTKPDYEPILRELRTAHVVRSLPRLSLTSPAHRTVRITVKALGVPIVNGHVTLTARGGQHRTLALFRGQAVFSADWIYAGNRQFTVSYSGSLKVIAGAVTRSLVVR